MKILQYIILILKMNEVELYFIKNQNKLICANCKFFIPTNNGCSNFGEVDIITNEYDYEEAIVVRKDDTKCGEDAIFFKPNYFKFITVPYYYIVEHKDIIIFLSSIIVSPFVIVFLMTQ